MNDHSDKVMYFAETDARNRRIKFGIKEKDRSRHMYIIGKTGMGKSTLLENLAIQDIQSGHGIAFIDPHGKTADLLLEYVPEDRIKDVLYFAPFDMDYPVSFNVMEDVGADKRHLVANGLMSAFKKIWVDAWSARMEYILNNILLALLEYPDSTLIGVNRMLADEDYRKKVVDYVTDPSVKAFWRDEFAKYGPKYMQEAGAAIQNKIGQFISNPLVRNIIGQSKSTFDIRQLMDNKKIIIINLSKGRVGESNANLLGAMLITKIYLGAMSRADTHDIELQKLPPFSLYVDEFQNFANESFADILSEARKYKLNLIVAHQYIEQMTEEVRAAIFGNVGTMVVFRVGAFDAEFLEKEFSPQFMLNDLVNLGFAQIYIKLMIDGVTSRPFSATTLPPITPLTKTFRSDIIDNSRKTFARPRADVEDDIMKWHQESEASADSSQSSGKKSKSSGGKSPIDMALEAVMGKPISLHTPNSSSTSSSTTKVVSTSENKIVIPTVENISNQREKDLRKAVSLSYLRQNHAKPKEKKIPSEKNLSDLRQALSSVVDIANTPKTEHSSHSSTHTRKTEYREKVTYTTPEREEKKAPPKEVPEDILKKILEI